MAVQLPAAFGCGFRFRLTVSFFSAGVRKIIFMMAPRSFGLALSQVSIVIFTAVASLISPGAITVFHFANNLHYLPVGVFGVSFAVASFPLLSRFYVERNDEQFFREFLKTFRKIVVVAVPAAVMFFLLRAHIIRVLLGTGNFDWYDTRLTAGVLGAFSLGIIFLSLIPLCTRAFFARHNTKTPVIVNTVGTILGVLLP
jgi:putative peptidoglycan lipid II flippase